MRVALPLLILPVVLVVSAPGTVYAAGGSFKLGGTFVVGESIRTERQDASFLADTNSSLVGIAGTNPGNNGRNGDDSNLNFNRGDPVSRILKAYLQLEYRDGDAGFVVSGRLWSDLVLALDDHPWGNWGNGYAPGRRLSDDGVNSRAKFTGAALNEAYLFGRTTLAGQPLDWRAGAQEIEWGHDFYLGEGLLDINPLDMPAATRPGVLRAEESRIPIPALFVRFGSPTSRVEAYWQFLARRTILPVNGTFWAQNDFASEGSRGVVFVGNLSDRAVLDPAAPPAVLGAYGERGKTDDPTDGQEGGIAYRLKVDSIATDFGLHAVVMHSRLPFLVPVKARREPNPVTGSTFVPLPLDVLDENPYYYTDYPEHIPLLGLSTETRWKGGSLFGEYTMRLNQPLGYNAQDMVVAFVNESPAALTPLRTKYDALDRGAAMQGYERFKVGQLQLGIIQLLPGVLHSRALRLGVEVLHRHVLDLPDPTVTRFGRSDVFGSGPVMVDGVLTSANPALHSGVADTLRGYVTDSATAYGFQAALIYGFAGAEVIPSVFFAHDVDGWSDEYSINEGRMRARVSVRANFLQHWSAEVAWQPVWGGDFNKQRDRDTAQFSLGYQF